MKRILAPIILTTVICQLLLAFDEKDAKERIKEIKAWLPTFEYKWQFKVESEQALEKAILFAEEPLKYVNSVRGLDHLALWRDIFLYETFLYETKKASDGQYFLGQLYSITQEMSVEKVALITFVHSSCRNALEGESIAYLYCRLFNSHTPLFIKYLSRQKNWKQLVGGMGICSAYDTKEMLGKLGNSKFEKELKEYLLTLYPAIRELME